MPVESNNRYRRHDYPDYSFSLRNDTSRDFARRRRYGEEDGHAMSQVSTPLHLPKLGRLPKRSYSPLERHEGEGSSRGWDEHRTYTRRAHLSTPTYHALEISDQLLGRTSSPTMMTSNSLHYDDDDAGIEEDQRLVHPRNRRSYYTYDDEALMTPLAPVKTSRLSSYVQERTVDQGRSVDHKQEDDVAVSYVMPVTRRNLDHPLLEEEEAIKEMNSYVTKRNLFPLEDDENLQNIKSKKYQMRTRGLPLMDDGYDQLSPPDRSRGECDRAPMFVMKLRSHVIWEKMYVKFTCTIKGSPPPRVTWYHNLIPIEPHTAPAGKYKLTNQYGVYSLVINKAEMEDSGTYRLSAQNYKGEISSYATLLVRRYNDGKTGYFDMRSGYNLRKPTDYPDVEKLNVSVPKALAEEERQDSLSLGPITAVEIPASAEVRSAVIAATLNGTAEKYETVLEFKIPGPPMEPKYVTIEETEMTTAKTVFPLEETGHVITENPIAI